jgi:hypothetical protein
VAPWPSGRAREREMRVPEPRIELRLTSLWTVAVLADVLEFKQERITYQYWAFLDDTAHFGV